MTFIDRSAFEGCSGLASITIANSVVSIGKDIFKNCSSLNSIRIPNSVNYIGENAIDGCSRLKILYVNNHRPPILDGWLASQEVYDNCILYVPVGSEHTYSVSTGWNGFKNIKTMAAEEKVPEDLNDDGVVDTQDVLEIYKYIQEH